MAERLTSGDGVVAKDRVRIAFEWIVPSDVRFIEHIVGSVTKQCSVLEFPHRQCALNVPVALSEALSNAILRGNKEDPEKLVRVWARFDPRTLILEVVDEGAGFDLDACTIDASSPEHLTDENGRGLFLMRRLMDRVERFEAGGNVVRLTLFRQ
jgi:serine/threonine-protein kinase RsbW